MVSEPRPFDDDWPRYSIRDFPAYRYIPGKTPHPRRHPLGHSYNQQESQPTLLPPNQWEESADYLYGIDLYNFAYWWECHEVFEGLWHAAGRKSEQGRFFQALIQLAAAQLKRFMKQPEAADTLLRKGTRQLKTVRHSPYMGIDLVYMHTSLEACFSNSSRSYPLIVLHSAV